MGTALRSGRPPRLDEGGAATRERLLAAAAAACIEHGFEAATVADIARRADVSGPAIYNHFGGKGELLVAAGRAALARLAPPDADPGADGGLSAADVVTAYFADDFAPTRCLLAELHLAGQRHPDVAELLAAWHLDHASHWAQRLGRPDALADVKAFFILLMGLCHLDSLGALAVPAPVLRDRLVAALAHLIPEPRSMEDHP